MVPQYGSILVGVQKRNRHDVDEADDDDGDGDGVCRTLGFVLPWKAGLQWIMMPSS